MTGGAGKTPGPRAAARALALAVLLLPALARVGAGVAEGADDGGGLRFPAALTDVDGAAVDPAALAGDGTLVVVTLKATWCPVCRAQLARLERLRGALDRCGARFVVLAPGTPAALARVRAQSGFAATWVADADGALARSLGLRMSDTEMFPAMLAVDRTLAVRWRRLGRNDAFYGEEALLEHLDCVVAEA